MLLPHSYYYPNLSEGADHVGGQLRGDKECPFSGVTSSGRVWRKVPESDARSVVSSHIPALVVRHSFHQTLPWLQTPSSGLRHPSFGGRCRKVMLGVWCTPTSQSSLSGTPSIKLYRAWRRHGKGTHSLHGPLRAQELCESRGGRPGLPSLISLRFLWT